jgi:hypothetical protein
MAPSFRCEITGICAITGSPEVYIRTSGLCDNVAAFFADCHTLGDVMLDAFRIVAPQRAIPRLFAALLCAVALAAANDAPADETQTSTVFYGGQVFTGECAARAPMH